MRCEPAEQHKSQQPSAPAIISSGLSPKNYTDVEKHADVKKQNTAELKHWNFKPTTSKTDVISWFKSLVIPHIMIFMLI